MSQKISVIIPGYRPEYMDETLYSLYTQTVQPNEILYYHSKGYLNEKINKLVSIATGDAILVLSDDDKLEETFIEKTSKIMQEKDVDIVYTDVQKFGKAANMMLAGEWEESFFRVSTPVFITSLVKKSMFEKVGGWDNEQKYGDYDFWYRCFKEGATAYHLHEPLFMYRIHDNSGSNNMSHDEARNLFLNKHPELK